MKMSNLLPKKGNIQPHIRISDIITNQGNSGIYNNRLNLWLLLCILLVCGTVSELLYAETAYSRHIQSGIADEIIRFHVIANSDSIEDQNLKYLVKDGLVNRLSPYLKKAESISEARAIIIQQIPMIQETAKHILCQNGYSYPVIASLTSCYFPIKIYGDYTFPAGKYEALRVQIGKAQGKNWWCVMFPPLCFVDETYGIVDKDSEKKLKYLLTEEEIQSLKTKKAPVKVKFKLWESLQRAFSK
jgi:stage II sporulation protein R